MFRNTAQVLGRPEAFIAKHRMISEYCRERGRETELVNIKEQSLGLERSVSRTMPCHSVVTVTRPSVATGPARARSAASGPIVFEQGVTYIDWTRAPHTVSNAGVIARGDVGPVALHATPS